MIRSLKGPGFALAAVFAFSALATSIASAQQGVLTSEGPVTLTGMERKSSGPEDPVINKLTLLGNQLNCKTTFTGHKWDVTSHEFLESGATTITITPSYKECNNGKVFDMNGCDLVFHIGETTGVTHTYGTTTDIICPVGKSIEITRGEGEPCDITIPAQAGIKGPHLTHTTGSDDDIDLKGTYTGITANACHGFISTTTAELHVDVTITGHNELGEQTAVTITNVVR